MSSTPNRIIAIVSRCQVHLSWLKGVVGTWMVTLDGLGRKFAGRLNAGWWSGCLVASWLAGWLAKRTGPGKKWAVTS